MADDIHRQLTKYLTDAHSIEIQALAQLRSAPGIAGDPELAAVFEAHLAETEEHERLADELLEARGASPSRAKDAVMAVVGKGFILFARSQPDTPGKLLAHATSYEGLELAAWDLLSRVAERAGEEDVASTARRIRDEEQGMIERLERNVDRAVAASLRAKGADELAEDVRSYLADAHALEAQAIELLEKGSQIAGADRLAAILEEHLAETRDHQELVAERLQALGGDPSSFKDAALRAGALNWGLFFRAHPDTPGKLAAFTFAFEHLEIGGYEQLKRVAERAGDAETVALAERILTQEREAAERIRGAFDEAVTASLRTLGVAG